MIGPRQILLGTAGALVLSGAAIAADVPIRAPQPVYTKAAPAWSWEGQYIGIHGGYFDGTNNITSGGAFEFNPRGGYGGLQFGYLHHLSRNWVIGYEVDVSFGDIDGAGPASNHSIDYFGTARTRLGYAQGPWLFYGTAGLAWAATNFAFAAAAADRAQVGYAVGAGVEYAFARNWSARVEYLYMDLDTTSSTGAVLTTDLTAHTVRFGLNYRFANWNPAADPSLPVKAPVYATGWTGPYIGVHAAYGFGDYDATGLAVVSLEPKGGVFGIQSGYNWQLSRNWVFGVEGDSSWGSIKQAVGASSVDIDAMGTVRARFGYAAGNTLLYATGGLAWIHADSVTPASVRDNFYLGWTAGVGVEYALSQKWSAKLEYLYSDYSSTDTGAGFITDDFSIHTIKLGVNYRAGILDLIGVRW